MLDPVASDNVHTDDTGVETTGESADKGSLHFE